MMDVQRRRRNRWSVPILIGPLTGLAAGAAMLLTALVLRWILGVPTATEMIFDRAFPLISIDFFVRSIVWAGGYTPLKLNGVYGALAGQLVAAMISGVAYAWYMGGRDPRLSRRRALALVVPSLLCVWLTFVVVLWPNLVTEYHGVPPGWARFVSALGLLVDFAVCAFGIMLFYEWLADVRLPAAHNRHSSEAAKVPRRVFLFLGVTAAVSVLLGAVLRRLFELGTFAYDGKTNDAPGVDHLTSNDRFYSVTKNIVDPDINPTLWRLEVGGLVDHPRTFTLEELKAMPSEEQETTLMCISNPVGGGLISNARWTGVPLPQVLRLCAAKEDAAALLFHAADGYYETIPVGKAFGESTLLAYLMNGSPLPHVHGAPLRLITPGLYGEKNPKWLTRVEMLAEGDPRLVRRHGCGFYKEQGLGPQFHHSDHVAS